jgi:RNA polymerase sigma-70 factor (ECF subfamily)
VGFGGSARADEAHRSGDTGGTGRVQPGRLARRERLTDLTSTDFADLLTLAQGGDEDAFAAIWRRFQAELVRYLRVVAQGAADDLAADTWLQVMRNLATFRGDDAAFRAWLYTIARHRHIDWRRQVARRHESLAPLEDLNRFAARDDPALAMETKMSTEAALALVATLPPDQAEAVMLRSVAGLSVATVAQIMNRPPGTVRVLTHRGLRRLEHVLEAPVSDASPQAAGVVV